MVMTTIREETKRFRSTRLGKSPAFEFELEDYEYVVSSTIDFRGLQPLEPPEYLWVVRVVIASWTP